ncbi:MAG: Ig-like domain-containing protein, partial [Haliea sp.]
MSNGNKGNSGNSGNSNNGTETSFTKTPQAKDDALGTPQTGKLNYVNTVYMLDVMSNDLGGKAKSLWSVDDGVNDSGAMSGDEAGDLLTQDAPGATGITANRSLFGAALHVTADGRVAYDTATIDLAHAEALTGLALGETLTDSFIYAIRLANGTLSWAKATVVLTGVNDTPVVQSVSLAAIEDGGPVTGSFDGDDVDSDDDGSSLIYNVIGSPDAGTLTNNGDGTFTFAPGMAFQTLAVGQTTDINLTYTATDKHGAVSAPADLAVTVTGVNDAPVAAPDTGETDADTVVTLDVLVNDTDIDDGDVLTISSASSGSGGTVQIINNELVFDPRDQFNHLIKGELEDVILTYSVSDGNGGSDTATVTVTVEGTNTPPDAIDDEVSIPEENGVVVAVLDNDIDPDPGEILTVTDVAVLSGGGSAAIVNDEHGNGIKVSWLPGLTPAPHDDSAPGHDESDPGHHDSSELIPLHDTLGAGETAEVTLEYTIKDRFDVTDTATVTITVTGENDAPVAHADSGSTEENQILLLDVLANDTDIDTNDTHHLEFANITQGDGTASVDSNLLRWAPGSDYDYLNLGESATVEIDYTITDNSGVESSSTATITVTGKNDAPVAQADAGSTTENEALTLDVLANDLDVDANDTRTLKTVTAAAGN